MSRTSGNNETTAEKNRAKTLESCVTDLLVALGEDPTREGLLETPRRVARMYQEVFSGLTTLPPPITLFNAPTDPNMIVVRGLSFTSFCEHHLLPFSGHVDVGYIPGAFICGLSKFARVVDYYAARPQIQEIMTNQIRDYLIRNLVDPQGLIVRVEAEHMCMVCRGVRKPGSTTVTAAYTGVFDDLAVRQEFYANLRGC